MNKGSKLKNAILYATSLYEGAEECKKLPQVRADVEKLSKAAADDAKDFALLNNPIWSLEVKEKITTAVQTTTRLQIC